MHKASRVQELPQPASPEGGEDRRPPIPVRDPSAAAEDRSRQPEDQREERSPVEAGRNTLRCLQVRSDQQWEEEIPPNYLKRFRGRTRGSHLLESRANRGPREDPRSPELDTRHHMRTTNDDDHRAAGTPYRDRRLGEPGTEATKRRRRQRRSRRSSTKRGCFSIQSRRAQPNPRPGCRSNSSYPTP